MIQGPLNKIMHNLKQGSLPWDLVKSHDGLIGWIDVGEAMLIVQELENWDEFIEKAPGPSQMFLSHLTHKMEGETAADLEPLLQLVRSAPFQSPVLEARIRLEQAVLEAGEGKMEQALEHSEWAEVRLGTLNRGGRHHSMAVIVRMNILIEADQGLRALHLCSETTRDGEHDPWTIGHTRLIAGRIMAAFNRGEEAIRVTWIALCLLRGVSDLEGAKEAASMLLAYSDGHEESDTMLVERTGLNLEWTYGQDVNPPASSGKVLAMNSPGLHVLDRATIEEFLSKFM